MNHFSRGLAAIGNFFAPAFGLIRAALDGDVTAADATRGDNNSPAAVEATKKRGGYSGAKLERKVANGCVGMATLR